MLPIRLNSTWARATRFAVGVSPPGCHDSSDTGADVIAQQNRDSALQRDKPLAGHRYQDTDSGRAGLNEHRHHDTDADT